MTAVDRRCRARLSVWIGRTAHEMRCNWPQGHLGWTHRSTKGSEWIAFTGAEKECGGASTGCEQDGESEPRGNEMVCTGMWVDHGPLCPQATP